MSEWRDVVGFMRYQVSDKGAVRNKLTGKLLTGTTNADGYTQVRLRPDEGETKTRVVHRLVAVAFLGPPGPGQVCNHKDGVKANNAVGNVEWVTRAENAAHAVRLGLTRGHPGEKNPKAKLRESDVLEMRRLSRLGFTYTELAARYGVSTPTAYRAIVGRTWGHVPMDDLSRAVRRGIRPAFEAIRGI